MEHAQPLEHQPPSRRARPIAAATVAAVSLAGLLGLAGARLLPLHRTPAVPAPGVQAPAASEPAAGPAGPGQPPAQPLRPRSRVSVLVLNGNGVTGAAGAESARLLHRGYGRAATADAPDGYATSLVLYRPGWEGEANRLARDAGIRVVAALDGRLPPSDAAYGLVLILGAG